MSKRLAEALLLVEEGLAIFDENDPRFFFLVSWGGVRLNPLGMSANIWLFVPALDDR
jgi:hypothetical protein